MKGFVGTVVSGAIGCVALYVVGKIAFRAGYEIATVEHRHLSLTGCESDTEKTDKESAPVNKTGMLFKIGKFIRHPESHKVEAYIKGREIRLNVKPKDKD